MKKIIVHIVTHCYRYSLSLLSFFIVIVHCSYSLLSLCKVMVIHLIYCSLQLLTQYCVLLHFVIVIVAIILLLCALGIVIAIQCAFFLESIVHGVESLAHYYCSSLFIVAFCYCLQFCILHCKQYCLRYTILFTIYNIEKKIYNIQYCKQYYLQHCKQCVKTILCKQYCLQHK